MIGLYWHFCETILFLLPESFLMLISVFEYSQRPLRAICWKLCISSGRTVYRPFGELREVSDRISEKTVISLTIVFQANLSLRYYLFSRFTFTWFNNFGKNHEYPFLFVCKSGKSPYLCNKMWFFHIYRKIVLDYVTALHCWEFSIL